MERIYPSPAKGFIMLADLHTHSTYSDGWYSPHEVCARAKVHGVSLLSITDHDTLADDSVKRAAAAKYGLLYVTGWEISAYLGQEKMHILGYGCKADENYLAFMTERKNMALLRAEDSVQKLQALGIAVTMDDVFSERSAPDLPVHTMHIARATAKKVGLSETEAYLRYFAIGKPAQSNIGRPTPKQAIDCIHASGGIAIVAHPGRITLPPKEKEETIENLIAWGLDGIECYYTTHTKEETEYFVAFAKKKGLYISGGSDTHFEEETHKIGFPKFQPDEKLLLRLGL